MVRNWYNENINLGIVRVGKKQTVIFRTSKEDLFIDSINTPCKCSKAVYNKEDKELVVIYTPGKIPHHLVHKGAYETRKVIKIKYKNGEEEVLSFKATVIK